MKTKKLLIAGVLAAFAFSGGAFADDRDDWKDARKSHEKAQREYEKDRREARREYEKDRREDRREYEKDRREYLREVAKDRREAEREYRRWARGDHIPRDYLVDRYYVREYRDFDLRQPPRGYRWVRPYEDAETFYLVQIATGLVSEIFGD